MEKDNTTAVLIRLIEQLKIPVTRQSVSDELQKRPDYGSLLAYSDVLNNWRVPNAAYKLAFDQLADVPLPFIAHTKKKQFAVVNALNAEYAVLSDEKLNNSKMPLAEFKKTFSGSVLVAEKEETSGEAGYHMKYRRQLVEEWRMPVVFVGAILMLLAYLLLNTNYFASLNLPLAFLTIFKTAGLATSVLLLVQSIDANNPLVQKLCGNDDNKNCNAILSSKAAKVNDYLTWSEVGFFYFAGTWLVLLFNSSNTPIMQMLALLNAISLPYTFYSIYYQWRVAKQWCVFCCIVQAILWLEFFAFMPYLLHGLKMPNAIGWISLAMGMTTPVLLWMAVKPLLLYAQQLPLLKQQLRKFKYNKELFAAALKEQPKYTSPDDDWSIVFGNIEANNVVTMVANPYCQPCAKAHRQIETALGNLDNLQVRVIFVGNNTNEKNSKTNVHRHMMALNALKDKSIVTNALHDWYDQKQKNYDAWAEAYPVTLGTEHNARLEKQRAWVDLAEIRSTPTLLLNGYKLPKTYQLHELKYMLE